MREQTSEGNKLLVGGRTSEGEFGGWQWGDSELHHPFSFSGCEHCLPPLLFPSFSSSSSVSSSCSCSSSSSPLLFSFQISSPGSRRGVSALQLPPPLPRSLPPPGAAGSLRAAAPQEDVSQGVASAALATSAAAGSAEWRGGARGPSGACRAAVRRREGDHPGHVGARLQELRGRGGVCAHKVKKQILMILLSRRKTPRCVTVCVCVCVSVRVCVCTLINSEYIV